MFAFFVCCPTLFKTPAMFDAVRNNKRFVQIFLLLITVPFALWGVESLRSVGGGNDVATVGSAKVSLDEFQKALREQQGLMRSQFPEVDLKLLDSPDVRKKVLDNLVDQRLLSLEADKLGLVVSDAALHGAIASIPAFQENGLFSQSRYEKLLSGQGKSPVWFEMELREELKRQALLGTAAESGFVPQTVLARVQELLFEQRQIQEVQVSWKDFEDKVQVDPAEIQKFYEANTANFGVPEQMRVEYVVFSQRELDALEKKGTTAGGNAASFVVAAESLRDLAFNQPESLDPVVDQFKLVPQQSGWISRQPNPANGVVGHPKLVEALFVESVIKEGHNAEVVEVAPGVIVAARMLEHKPASVLPLDQVKSMIEAGLRQEKAVALAVKQGEEKLAALKAGKAEEKNWGKVRSVSRLTPDGIPPSNLSAIFRVNAAALPGYAGAELPGVGYGLYKVSKTELVQAGKDEIEGLKEMQKGMVAQAEQKAYMEALRERYKIKINEELLQLNEEKEQEQQ